LLPSVPSGSNDARPSSDYGKCRLPRLDCRALRQRRGRLRRNRLGGARLAEHIRRGRTLSTDIDSLVAAPQPAQPGT
jgi:hypothetical protein